MQAPSLARSSREISLSAQTQVCLCSQAQPYVSQLRTNDKVLAGGPMMFSAQQCGAASRLSTLRKARGCSRPSNKIVIPPADFSGWLEYYAHAFSHVVRASVSSGSSNSSCRPRALLLQVISGPLHSRSPSCAWLYR